MRSMSKWLGMGLIALAVTVTSDVVAGMATPGSIIVMPARKRVVQLAFQVACCKDVGLVTYNTATGTEAPLIHVWNGSEWVQITLEDYVQGSFMSGEPKRVFLLSDSSSSLPLRMADEVAWYKNLERVNTLDITTLINTFGKSLKFSSRQWKWLAEENGMKIQDKSTERRRYGRWGAPGKEHDLKPTKLENIELPPSPLITDPIVEPKKELPAVKVEKVEAKVATPKVELPAEPVKVDAKVEAPVVTTKDVEVEKVEVKTEPVKPVDPTTK